MPFIDAKLTVSLTKEQRERIKSRLGKSVSLLHKSERYLMVGLNENYALWLGGKALERGAFVAVSLFGGAASSEYERMTGEICAILSEEAGIPSDCVYVTYQGISDWGWNGANF